jgi:hypothetical protein
MAAARSCLASLIAAVAMSAPAPSARSADPLPPERPATPYRARVRNTYAVVEPGGGRSGGDTLEIRVSGPLLFEDSQILEARSVIVDTEKREVLEFDPADAEKVATRFALNEAPIPYVGGRAAIAAIDPAWGAPLVAGEDEVAKRRCTVLHFGSPEADGAAACVSKEGVVLRLRLVWPGYERDFELLDFDPGRQDEKWFRPPKGFRIVEGAGG